MSKRVLKQHRYYSHVPVREREKGLRNRKSALTSVTHCFCQHNLRRGHCCQQKIQMPAVTRSALVLRGQLHQHPDILYTQTWEILHGEDDCPGSHPACEVPFLGIINTLCLSKKFFTNAHLAVPSRRWVSFCDDGRQHLQVLSLHSSPRQLHHGGWT